MLAANATKCIEMFRAWDENADHMVSRREFRRAVERLGFPREYMHEADKLYSDFDRDGSGGVVRHSRSRTNTRTRRVRLEPTLFTPHRQVPPSPRMRSLLLESSRTFAGLRRAQPPLCRVYGRRLTPLIAPCADGLRWRHRHRHSSHRRRRCGSSARRRVHAWSAWWHSRGGGLRDAACVARAAAHELRNRRACS